MTNHILAHPTMTSNTARFVPPQSGKELYNAGKPYRACVTDNQRSEWIAAAEQGRQAYYTAMSKEGAA